jgi:hypothetical protein
MRRRCTTCWQAAAFSGFSVRRTSIRTRSSRPGYDVHHIVEKTPALEEGFPKSLVNGPDNLVSIPRFKHWEITGWYARKSKDWDRLSPRMMLDPQPWSGRYQFGLYALRKFQVMK